MLVYWLGALVIQTCLSSHVIETKLPGVTEVLDLGGEAMRRRSAGYLREMSGSYSQEVSLL